ncbi:hypothetical protein BDV40DRAFT_262146 [Aspergillus tamarii]|uniref:Uncharacterized protein n=1 Tax=Aspergillus tamarii TaxID=41984 RepID=A0A5N6UYX7_ASPTM|nr:hypothetical protein BDV40DRAFT_262146 [Aspergillus tamarii]
MEHVHTESCIAVRSFDKHSFFSSWCCAIHAANAGRVLHSFDSMYIHTCILSTCVDVVVLPCLYDVLG